MIIIYQFLIAAALIALMILVRVFANRAVLQQRLSCDHSDKCGEADCPDRSDEKRSACHAP